VTDALLERQTEVDALRRALEDSAAGRGQVVVVEAAPGLGKTTLLRHTRDLAGARGFRVLSARGSELERDFAFGVIRQMFDPVLAEEQGEREHLFKGAAKATEGLFGTADLTEAPPAGSLYLLLNGLYWLLVNLTARSPVVLLIDDLQWVDGPSLRFVEFLSRRIDSTPVMVVLTSRPRAYERDAAIAEVMTAPDATVLEPKSLSLTAVAELTAAFIHAVVADVVRSLIPLAERGAEHDAAAALLRESGETPARVASHLLRTTPGGRADRVTRDRR
jgi:AAA ATPase domain